jgi:hypothetical protein
LDVLAVLACTILVNAANLPTRAVAEGEATGATANFPPELVHWNPRRGNPVFTAEGPGHWDARIRERGWILREGGGYHMWFTGYDGSDEGLRKLGYAWSSDGVHWKRWPKNPLVRDRWVEDMMVVKRGDTYYMFAEGRDDNHAVMLTSKDRIHWKWQGPLDIRLADGTTPAKRPCGTPTIWIENDTWYLFYEYLDLGVWLAKISDVRSRIWVNVQDEPVLVPGPAAYDKELIALNQIIRHRGAYYAFYHGSGEGEPRTWNTNIARSTDLVHWQKYPRNPLIEQNKSSGIVVPDGRGYRLYTMHDEVDLYCPSR